MAKIVIALGGNALSNDVKNQKATILLTSQYLVEMISDGHQIIIVHGNGPQIGMINLAFNNGKNEIMPFAECGAMSQGYIGFHLQNSLQNLLRLKNINKEVVTLITQVVVNKNDLAFKNPTKPIGNFYSKIEAEKLINIYNFAMKEDSGRGWRRVIASPEPIDILEKRLIIELFNEGNILITCGGGGIPVILEGTSYYGIASVIDKDLTASKLADILNADQLLILTAVDYVSLNFNKSTEKQIKSMTVQEAKQYIAESQFAPGSMLPKIIAAINFVSKNKKRKAIIANLKNANKAVNDESGTIIIN